MYNLVNPQGLSFRGCVKVKQFSSNQPYYHPHACLYLFSLAPFRMWPHTIPKTKYDFLFNLPYFSYFPFVLILFLLTQLEWFLTIDMIFRYTAICHPLKPSLHSGKRRTIYIIVAIWIFCMIPSAWWLVYGKVRDLNLELQIFMSYETKFSLKIHSKVIM